MEEFILGLNEGPKNSFIDCAKYIEEPLPLEITAKFRSPDVEVPTLEVDPEWERLASQTEGEREHIRRKAEGNFPVFPVLPGTIGPSPTYSQYETAMLTKQDEIIEALDRILDRLCDLESNQTAYDFK